MKTQDMVALLAAGVEPVDRRALGRRFGWALLAGGGGALILMLLSVGLRPDLDAVLAQPIFWAKMAFPLLLAAAALPAAARLSRPGVPVRGRGWATLAAPVLIVWAAAAVVLLAAPDGERLRLLMGSTWRRCPLVIAFLSVPGFLAVMWAIRGLATTRPRLAGAIGGLLAGAVATVAYCLHCPEMEVPFWAVWYLLGMLLPAGLGALLGPRLLRW